MLAFSIDAWWDNHKERIEERRILESLKAEFLANAKSIPLHIEGHRKSVEHTRALLDAMTAAERGSTVRYPAAEFRHVLGHTSTDPQSGALDAILQSGELRYISNPAIRERLAAWPTLVVDATENGAGPRMSPPGHQETIPMEAGFLGYYARPGGARFR